MTKLLGGTCPTPLRFLSRLVPAELRGYYILHIYRRVEVKSDVYTYYVIYNSSWVAFSTLELHEASVCVLSPMEHKLLATIP